MSNQVSIDTLTALTIMNNALGASAAGAAGFLAASSGLKAAATASVTLTGTTTANLAGLTQLIINSDGATGAGFVTCAITGIATSQVSGTIINMVYPYEALAVSNTPFIINFNPPIIPSALGNIKVELSALGSGNLATSVTLLGRLIPTGL